MSLAFQKGDRVHSREGLCIVESAQKLEGEKSLLGLRPLDGREVISLVCPPDILVKLPSLELDFDRAGFAPIIQWWTGIEALDLSLVRETGSLFGALFGRVELEAYQLAPALRILSKPRPRLLISDDVGIGKTVEAGLCMLELIYRKRASRILIVAPPGLLDQWQEELIEKLNLDFELIENAAGLARVQTTLPAGVSPWDTLPRVLTSLEYLKKKEIRDHALRIAWDLIVVDEAHYLAESGTPQNPYRTKRTGLGMEIAKRSRGLLLLTATPHNGYQNSFRSLIEYIEPTAATLLGSPERRAERIERARIRRLKVQIKRRDASGALVDAFLKRSVDGIPVQLDESSELPFYKAVSNYCSKITKSAESTEEREIVSFAMQIIKKRMLSSRAALARTLDNRLKALSKPDEREEKPEKADLRDLQADLPMSEVVAERIAQRLVKSAIPSDEKLRKTETQTLKKVKKALSELPDKDPKIEALLKELHAVLSEDPNDKIIIFTEYLDTLQSIKETLERDTQLAGTWSILKGGMSRKKRTKVQEEFSQPSKRILLATDAASEGLNLQRHCHRIIHFELPWNPNRLEQRNGRVDRYGQTKHPIIKYLYFPQTPEDNILSRLASKIEKMQSDRISTPDILGIAVGMDIEDRVTELDGSELNPEKAADRFEKVFKDRTAEYVTKVQPLLLSGFDVTKEIENLHTLLEMSTPLLGDDTRLEKHLLTILGNNIKPTDVDGIFTIQIPRRFRGPNVKQFYPRVTCRRSIAVKTKPADVEFITPIHPLVQAIGADARQRFVQVYDEDSPSSPRRMAARTSSEVSEPTILFIFLANILTTGDTGAQETIEERLIPVSISVSGQVRDDQIDQKLLDDRSDPGNASLESVATLFTQAFKTLLGKARDEAVKRVGLRLKDLIRERERMTEILIEDVRAFEQDRLKEIDEEEALARAEFKGAQAVFAFEGTKSPFSFEARRAAVATDIQGRLKELEAYSRILDPAPPQAIGALFIMPVGGAK